MTKSELIILVQRQPGRKCGSRNSESN